MKFIKLLKNKIFINKYGLNFDVSPKRLQYDNKTLNENIIIYYFITN